MQTMQQALATSSTSRLASSPERAVPAPQPVAVVERVFDRLAAILGPRLADVVAASSIEKVKAEWGKALAGFSFEEIARGLDETRSRKFPPNLPEFLHLCRPGLDPEVAWCEAELGLAARAAGERFPWSHWAIYWAARDMVSEITGSTFAKHRKRWEVRLKAEFAKGVWNSPPDPSQRRIAHTPPVVEDPVGREEAKKRMRELQEGLRRRAAARESAEALVTPSRPESEEPAA